MNEHQLQTILHNINQGVLLINADGTVGTANSRLKSLLNVPPDRLTGKHFDELHDNPALNLSESFGFAGDGLFMLVKQLQAGVALESTIGYEIINAGRRRYIRRSHIPIYDKDDNVISLLMIFTDETEIHELRQMEDEITSMIVHDLRSPLSAVSSTVRLLRDSADPNDPFGDVVLETTTIADRALRKLINLVNSILDVTRIESGADAALHREPSELYETVNMVVDELRPMAAEMGVKLRYQLDAHLPLLDIDPEKIERVLYNLVDNAIKFTPDTGNVTIDASASDELLRKRGFIRVEVRDTGSGIPPDLRERLFDRFQQIQGNYGQRRGSGMGLTFCKLAIEAHGGRIWIEDNPDGGSIFAFTLPVFTELYE